MRAFTWGDGLQVAAQDIRLGELSALLSGLGSGASPLQIGSGVRDGNGNPLNVAVSSGLSVTVATGFAIVQGTAAVNSGAYACTLDSVATLTCTTADPTNPRIDSVIVQVTDNGNNTSTATVNIQAGTPAPSPSPPTLPANSLRLCNITVNANATTLNSGNLADQRSFYAAAGGITPVRSSAAYPAAGPPSTYLHNIATGRLQHWNGSAVVAPAVAAFAPISSSITVSVSIPSGSPGAVTTITSLSFTVDGSTEVCITCKRPGIYQSIVVSGAQMASLVALDGTQIDGWFDIIPTGFAANEVGLGMTWVTRTTPAAGTHTLAWQANSVNSAQAFGVYAATATPAVLRVEAVSP